MRNAYDLSFDEIERAIIGLGEKKFHAKQVWQGLYRNFYQNWKQFSTLSKTLRTNLERQFSIGSLSEKDLKRTPDDSTRKSLFELPDGDLIESVLLRKYDRITLCISTQSGCPIGCVFCATGKLGFFRNLTAGEITEQAIYFQRLLADQEKKLTNIVLMGMGEPFLNYDNVMDAVKVLNHKDGLNIGARRITISTIGILDKIRAFADEESQVNLSVSLHAPSDELRRQLVPLANTYSVEDLINTCKYFFQRTGRRVTFEYVLIENINDQPAHAYQLADLLGDLTCHINLIPLNATEHYAGRAPGQAVMKEFGRILLKRGLTLSFRDSQGFEIGAGCGQLAGRNQ
jgi:23S rRNA (adenine2503-C2)-methyltransferase